MKISKIHGIYHLVLLMSSFCVRSFAFTCSRRISNRFFQDRFYVSSSAKFAKRKRAANSDRMPINTGEGWVTLDLGSEKDRKNAEMDERIKDTERWVSKELSDEEAELLHRSLGIEEELMDLDDDSPRQTKIKTSKVGQKQVDILNSSNDDIREAVRVKGFLEMNPYVCSGCGTPFQSKSSSDPGFLPKEKLQEHRLRAELIREKQEAIKILEMAGIEVDSDAAEQVLRDADVSIDVIESVRALGKGQRAMDRSYQGRGDKDSFLESPASGDSLSSLQSLAQQDEKTIARDVAENIRPGLLLGISRGDEASAYLSATEFSEENIREMLNRKSRLTSRKISKAETLVKKGKLVNVEDPVPDVDIDVVCICQRCFRLQQYGQVEEVLRPGWSDHDLLTPERFETLLTSIKDTEAVVLCLVDVFDLQGSLLPNLKQIAGPNPIVIAANKADLLPKDASHQRIVSWILAEARNYCGLRSPRQFDSEQYRAHRASAASSARFTRPAKETEEGVLRQGNVHLVSCQGGMGIDRLLGSVMNMAKDNGNKVFVMGAANVGKSSFINRLLKDTYQGSKSRAVQRKKSDVPQATVSNLPGTTLDFLKIQLPNGITMIDTPGLLNPGQLTARLTTAELRQVIPAKPINAVTLRVSEGKCVLIGGLANIELVKGRPFYFTFFISNEVKLHPTDSARVEDFLNKHVGTLVTPPASPERLAELGPFENHVFTLSGDSWRKASTDIVIAGLGWISVTGPGECDVRVTVPAGVSVGLRSALLPYEAPHTTAKFTGGRLDKRSKKPGETKSYGWRA